MKTPAACLMCLSTLLASSHVAGNPHRTIWCKKYSYFVGQTGVLTCHFSTNLSTHHGVYISFYPPSGVDEEVLTCKLEQLTKSECTAKNGFVFKSFTNTTLTVEIKTVTKLFEGRYACQFVPPDETKHELCSIEVNEKPHEEATAPNSLNSAFWALIVICLVILFVVCVILIRLLQCTRNGSSVKKDKGSSAESAPLVKPQDSVDTLDLQTRTYLDSSNHLCIPPIIETQTCEAKTQQQEEEYEPNDALDRKDASSEQGFSDFSDENNRIKKLVANKLPGERYNDAFEMIKETLDSCAVPLLNQVVLRDLLQNVQESCTRLKARPDLGKLNIKEVIDNIDKLLTFMEKGHHDEQVRRTMVKKLKEMSETVKSKDFMAK